MGRKETTPVPFFSPWGKGAVAEVDAHAVGRQRPAIFDDRTGDSRPCGGLSSRALEVGYRVNRAPDEILRRQIFDGERNQLPSRKCRIWLHEWMIDAVP